MHAILFCTCPSVCALKLVVARGGLAEKKILPETLLKAVGSLLSKGVCCRLRCSCRLRGCGCLCVSCLRLMDVVAFALATLAPALNIASLAMASMTVPVTSPGCVRCSASGRAPGAGFGSRRTVDAGSCNPLWLRRAVYGFRRGTAKIARKVEKLCFGNLARKIEKPKNPKSSEKCRKVPTNPNSRKVAKKTEKSKSRKIPKVPKSADKPEKARSCGKKRKVEKSRKILKSLDK